MIETRLVFRNEYRLDLKPVESILIPYLFNNESNLIISVDANPSRNYKSSGKIDQILIDYSQTVIGSSQILRFGRQLLQFPQLGRFKLKLYPNYYLGKTTISISTQEVIAPTSFDNCTSDEVALTANNTSVILAANELRTYALLTNNSLIDITIILGEIEIATPGLGIVIKPGGNYEINLDNLYKGVITAVSANDSQLFCVECSE
ncbi:hypothetical protein H6G80_03145 [Nostoc sp. FACHB-87]|uniref:hypothetical protein n=1 Tax=Nostocaceae TaxID=1162 RepID=UPI00168591AD|nr:MULTISPECIES: hypothetical protein [Nostocaceae]MBD2416066.1 hypothetical protein [Nostoc calcicola FACHB-3891]MBD2453070.1 hypothetical protein [Nostoc sp. FACHB-87]MBD2475152.1 hypothetical protein [Anabaena sp. FACHB-83]